MEKEKDVLLTLPGYTDKEIVDDLERDRQTLAAFGRIPAVRTLPLKGSKCDVFV